MPFPCNIVDDNKKSKCVGSGSHYLLNKGNRGTEVIASLDLQYIQYINTVQKTEISALFSFISSSHEILTIHIKSYTVNL